MPIYMVEVHLGDHSEVRLVDAPNEARAFKHVAQQHIKIEAVRTAAQITETTQLAARGIKVGIAAAE